MYGAADAIFARAQTLAATYGERQAYRIVPLLEEAAASGHPEALFTLGTWRHYGIGCGRDDAAAASLWALAAEAGHAEARFNFAIACERGVGVLRDPERAFALYEAAAAAGDGGAAYEAGRCLYYGLGTPENRASASAYFERARRGGHPEAICDAAEDDGPRRMPRPNAAGPFHATRGG